MPTLAPFLGRPGSANFFKNRYNTIKRALERRGETDAAEDAASACKMFAATAAAPAAAAATAAANDCVTTTAEAIARGRTTASAASRGAIYKRSSCNRFPARGFACDADQA